MRERDARQSVRQQCGLKSGVGNIVKFWEDNRVGDTTLYNRFSRLHSISNCKEKVIVEVNELRESRWYGI